MDNSRLVTLLGDAVAIVSEPNELALPGLLHKVEDNPEEADQPLVELLKHLREELELRIFDGKMQHLPDMGRRVEYRDLAAWLIYRASSVGEKQAVEDLERYLGETRVPILVAVAVGGLRPITSCDFENGLKLVPWEEVPDSLQKTMFYQQSVQSGGFHLPQAALVDRLRLQVDPAQLHIKQDEPIDYTEFHDALLCTGLVGPTAPYVLAYWLSPPEWAPIIGRGYSRPHVEGPGGTPGHLPAESCDEARRIYSAFSDLPQARKTRLRLPMQHINRAMRRSSFVDCAIDLGIALESLFLSDITPDRGEFTFRLKVRGARFLGSDYEDRDRLFKLLGDLYTARSQAVHTGRVEEEIRRVPIHELLETGCRLASEAIKRFIVEGEPDWKEIIFS